MSLIRPPPSPQRSAASAPPPGSPRLIGAAVHPVSQRPIQHPSPGASPGRLIHRPAKTASEHFNSDPQRPSAEFAFAKLFRQPTNALPAPASAALRFHELLPGRASADCNTEQSPRPDAVSLSHFKAATLLHGTPELYTSSLESPSETADHTLPRSMHHGHHASNSMLPWSSMMVSCSPDTLTSPTAEPAPATASAAPAPTGAPAGPASASTSAAKSSRHRDADIIMTLDAWALPAHMQLWQQGTTGINITTMLLQRQRQQQQQQQQQQQAVVMADHTGMSNIPINTMDTTYSPSAATPSPEFHSKPPCGTGAVQAPSPSTKASATTAPTATAGAPTAAPTQSFPAVRHSIRPPAAEPETPEGPHVKTFHEFVEETSEKLKDFDPLWFAKGFCKQAGVNLGSLSAAVQEAYDAMGRR